MESSSEAQRQIGGGGSGGHTLTEIPFLLSSEACPPDEVQRYTIHVNSNSTSTPNHGLSFIKTSYNEVTNCNTNGSSGSNDNNDQEWYSKMKSLSSSCTAKSPPTSNSGKSGDSGDKDYFYFLQTNAHVENTNILVLSSTNTTNNKSSKHQVEIDLTHLTSSSSSTTTSGSSNSLYLNTIIHTSSFFLNRRTHQQDKELVDVVSSKGQAQAQGGPVWKVICVDSNANLFILQFHCHNLTLSHMEYIPTPTPPPISSSPSPSPNKLTKSQILFPTHNQILYINPNNTKQYITNFHIPSKKCTIWKSTDVCLEYKKQSLSYFTCAKGLLVGKSPLDLVDSMLVDDDNNDRDDNNRHDDDDMDMDHDGLETKKRKQKNLPPSIAICSLSDLQMNPNTHYDTYDNEYDSDGYDNYDEQEEATMSKIKAICSLHIDGTMRLWTLLPTSSSSTLHISKMKMYPLNMRMLQSKHDLRTRGDNHWSLSMAQVWNQLLQSNANNTVGGDGQSFISMTGTFIKSSSSNDNAHSHTIEFDDDDDDDEEEQDNRNGLIGVYIQLKNKDSMTKTTAIDSTMPITTAQSTGGTEDYTCLTLYSFELNQGSSSMNTRMNDLIIPQNVNSMIDMGFTPMEKDDGTRNECKLNVLYNNTILPNRYLEDSIPFSTPSSPPLSLLPSIQLAIYEPMNVSATTTAKPILFNSNSTNSSKANMDNTTTMDSLALEIKEEIILQTNILLEDGYNLEDNDANDDYDLETMLQSIDEWYMKKLFRPSYGRSIGSSSSIRRAIKVIIPFPCINDLGISDSSTVSNNIEMETITAMKNWTSFSAEQQQDENFEESTSMDIEMSPPSIVDDNDHNAIHNEYHMKTTPTFNKRCQFLAHHKRWHTLLIAAWFEEAKLRTPLSFITSPKTKDCSEIGVVLRAGFASGLTVFKKLGLESNSNTMDKLDDLSTQLLDEFERENSNKLLLVNFEMKIWDTISKAKLVFQEEVAAVDSLFEGIIRAFDNQALDSLSSKVTPIVRGMSSDDIIKWLSTPLSSTLAYESCLFPSIISEENGNKNEIVNLSSDLPLATRLVQLYINCTCRLTLSRSILVLGVITSDGGNMFGIDEVNFAIRTYLHNTSMIWLHTQVATTSNSKYASKEGSTLPPSLLAFNPMKKSKIEQISLRKIYNPPSILEYHIKEVCEKSEKTITSQTYLGGIVNIAKKYAISTFQGTDNSPALTRGFTNKARLRLRLLAPFISYPLPSADDFDSRTRNGVVADCLLAEVDSLATSNRINEKNAKKYLKHASVLLLKQTYSSSVSPDKNDIDIFFSTMRLLPDDWILSTSVTSDQSHDERLLEVLQIILESNTFTIHPDEIKSLAKMDTLRKTLLPWVVASQRERTDPLKLMIRSISKGAKDPESTMKKSILVLLDISNLMNRATLIEKHSNVLTNQLLKAAYADVLLSTISDIIQEIQINFSPNICEYMGEYAALWSSTFRHAVIGHRWDDAFKTCLSNPLEDRREKNFKRLVLAMTEAGVLNKLINNVLFTVVDWQSSSSNMDIDGQSTNMIDLYELAAEVLVQTASEYDNIEIGQLGISSISGVDYRGCLYTLHAAHNDWRRCCQTMDLYGIISQGNLLTAENMTLSEEDQKEFDKNIMNEIVLSSVTSSQLIHLVPDIGHRYIVSGEIGPNLCPPSFMEQRKKDQINGKLIRKRVPVKVENSHNRIARLLTEQDLASRATRFMALRTLYCDTKSSELLVNIIDSSDRQLIEALARLGYFACVISIANCKCDDLGGARPGGRDVLADAISHMVCQYILPNTTKKFPSSRGEEWVGDEEIDGMQHRPTLNQLRFSSGDGALPLGCEVWRNYSRNNEVKRSSIAMNLVQKYIMKYSGSENSIAIEVAQTLLGLDYGRAELPLWLHDLLIGRQDINSNSSANSSSESSAKRTPGNACELVQLYVRKGLLSHACKGICDILTGIKGEREEQATNRLPEKGSIDFVPYDTINQVWNMVEAYARSPNCDLNLKAQLLSDRERMENSLERHFKILKISEMGILSARALNYH